MHDGGRALLPGVPAAVGLFLTMLIQETVPSQAGHSLSGW